MKILRRPELCYSCFCFHEGDPDLAVPPESQGSDGNHLRQPCGQGNRIENPRWREKMMRRRRNLIRVFTLARRFFIYKHVLSGPRAKARPVNIFYNGVKFCTQQMIIPKEKT
jgi:hypothetical protein